MTRQTSAARIKRHHSNGSNFDGLPREGTKLRALYDALLSAGPSGVELPRLSNQWRCVYRLRDEYGCDVRWVARGRYALVGERMASGVYVDYLS